MTEHGQRKGADAPAARTVCFTYGTLIDTPQGPRPVEALMPGDRVLTRDSGARPLAWIGNRFFSASDLAGHRALWPVEMTADALGDETGRLLVSPQHRLLIRSPRAEQPHGEREVLAPAESFLQRRGVRRIVPRGGVHYCHLLLEGHHVIRANGHWAETLFAGPRVADVLGPAQLAEISGILPDALTLGHCSARPLVSTQEARLLSA